MTEYFKKFTMDKDGVTVIDFGENEVFQCKYSDEAKSLCNRLNDLDYEKYNLKKENDKLKNENQRLTNKLNQTALELVDEVISQGKAVEISEMSYNEFLDYRVRNGKPMELQL